MSIPSPTKTWHATTYSSISPTIPALSTTNKVILITGGGSGLGPHIAHSFAASGSTSIALLGRTLSSLRATATSLQASFSNLKVLTLVADIVSPVAVNAAFAEAKAQLGPIDIFVSNAAYLANATPVGDADIEEWWRGMSINVKGSLILVQAFLKNMAENPTILHVTTGGAHLPAFANLSSYAVSKLAAIKFFEYVAVEYPHVRVMMVHPGVLDTEMGQKGKDAGVELPGDDISLPADFLVWAASPEAEFLKGRVLWSNWDVDELKSRKSEFEAGSPKFTIGLLGWP